MILRWTSKETLSENKKENKDPAKKYETDTFLQDFFCKNSLFAEKSGAYGWLQQDGWVDENPVYENVRKIVFLIIRDNFIEILICKDYNVNICSCITGITYNKI